jgi:hypothetical protein
MINVFTEGRVKNRKMYEDFACEVINELLPRAFKRDIDIVIGFTKKIDTLGYCQKIDEETIGILINTDQEPDAIASTIAHELVHAKQFIRGELNETMTRWARQEIPYGPRGGCKIPYHQQPWEQEAFEKEKWLTEMFWK